MGGGIEAWGKYGDLYGHLLRHAYTFLILLASDPFDVTEMWFGMNYQPPFWLFWLLVAIAISIAMYLAIRELRSDKVNVDIRQIPEVLENMHKRRSELVEQTLLTAKDLNKFQR